MAPVFGTIDMLKPGRSTFGLELRLIRCYENFNSGGVECIFHDRQAERIHVTIPGSNSEKFKNRLIEGKFPKCLFELKTLADIAQMENVGDSSMFDVIGAIVSHYRPQQKEINGKMTKLMDILLEDMAGNTITCTVWEHYVDEVIKFLDSGPEAPVGIIMQLCRASIFRGEVRVSTLFNVTKILTDQKLEDIREFIFGYLTTGKVRSNTISTLTSSSTRSLNDQIKDGDFEMKTISEILSEGKEEGSVSKIGAENAEEMVDSTEEPISALRSVDGNIDDVESVRRSKGKRKIHGDADEAAYICDGLETPPTMKSTSERKKSADVMNEEETNRKLIDEFSSNALKKRQKRNVKKE
ncbi:hypothetical protein C2S53_002029 [Perilla frutescens var. hirtella]|uniref:Uncharacterized protein n=1 Tax=Perilla frutescens var. hirtella TaxID=608512 RepID=A0AAD4IVP5_PERFH|nr:hypothetical protein C2S53_002029 [Perilla frutescens var. hirtella]